MFGRIFFFNKKFFIFFKKLAFNTFSNKEKINKVDISQLIYAKKAKAYKLFEKENFLINDSYDIDNKRCKFFHKEKIVIPNYKIFTISNGITKVGSDSIFDENFKKITGLSFQEADINGKEYLEIKNEKIKYIDGSVLSLGMNGLEENYYHCWVELAARIYAFKQSKTRVDYILLNIHNNFLQEILNILEIDIGKIIDQSKYKIIQAKNIVYPGLINNWEEIKINNHFLYKKKYLPSWLNNFYDDVKVKLISKSDLPVYKKIYIGRNSPDKRIILNQKNLVEKLASEGFKSINFVNFTLQEQVLLMKNARMIVGVHGAALANLSFCDKGAKVLELFPENYQDSSYRLQSNLKELEYNFYIGKSLNSNLKINPKDEDFSVETSKIINFIKNNW